MGIQKGIAKGTMKDTRKVLEMVSKRVHGMESLMVVQKVWLMARQKEGKTASRSGWRKEQQMAPRKVQMFHL